jgi:hypothetical protein
VTCLDWVGLEEVPEAAGEVALEAADGFFGALAFGAFAGNVVLGLGVAAQAGDGDAMDGRVDLAVAAAVEAVAVGLARVTGMGATPAARASLASLANLPAPAISPTSLAAVSGPRPGSQSSCGAIWAMIWAISVSSALIVCESSRMRRSSSRAMRTLIVCSARASRLATRGPQVP